MPIYEFYCKPCHTIFNFFSRRINVSARPACPRCGHLLQKQLSVFSVVGKAEEPGQEDLPPGFDETKMEQALSKLAAEADDLNEDDPRQMARLMRRLTASAGLPLGEAMEEALSRLEAGEDPDQIEQEMGDLLEDESALFGEAKKRLARRREPRRDETLYEL